MSPYTFFAFFSVEHQIKISRTKVGEYIVDFNLTLKDQSREDVRHEKKTRYVKNRIIYYALVIFCHVVSSLRFRGQWFFFFLVDVKRH